MPLTPDQWRKQLTAPALKPVQLLAGEELLVLEAGDALRARTRELGYDEREVLHVETRFDWDDLARAAAGMSLFATRRVLDLRLPTGKPGREGSAAITAYCKDPPPDTLLMITCTQWAKKQAGAWTRAIEKVGCMTVFWPPKSHEWPRWIANRLATHGVKASPDAVAMLADRVEGNLLAAAQEVDKLAVLHGEGTLDAATMEDLVTEGARFDVFKLTDAAFAGDAARALRIIQGLQAEGHELIALMGWLVNQLELALRLALAADFGAQAKTERLWQAREKLFRAALQRAPREHWQRCLTLAARIDRMTKGREYGDPWREAQRLVAAIAQPRVAGTLI